MRKGLYYSILFVALAAFLINISTPVLLQLSYSINKDYIIEQFCENKAKPQLTCNGKCHLAKQIAAVQEQSQEESKPVSFSYTPIFVFSVQ